MSQTAPRTLADQFRTWPDERLAALFRERPELAAAPPGDSAALAARVTATTAVHQALTHRSRLELAVLEAAIQLAPTSTAALTEVIHASHDSVAATVTRLVDLALLWGVEGSLRPVGGLPAALPTPSGPPVGDVPALVGRLGSAARALLDHLDQTDAPGKASAITGPMEELLRIRLAVLDDRRMLVLPWSVRVALREGRSTRTALDVPPPLATAERTSALLDRAAAGSAFEFCRRVETLLEWWGSRPPPRLKSGGLSARDLKSAASHLLIDTDEVALLLDVAMAARLLAIGGTEDLDAAWMPTEVFDTWVDRPLALRWADLAVAWLGSTRATGLVGSRDESGRPVNALVPDTVRHWLPDVRSATLRELAGSDGVLASGTGSASLISRLRWRTPRRGESHDRAVLWTLDEAAALGITGLGGLSGFGRALVAQEDPDSIEAALAPLLPSLVDHILIQADGTAVAPGPLTPDLTHSLSRLADVESRGGATVYRFTTGSIRRGFDHGWSATEAKDFLRSASKTPVPQSMDYLIDDVARRFGTLRVGMAEAFIRSDDEAALAELVAGAGSLDLRRIAPTVVISGTPLDVLLPRLRDLGLAPVVEAPDGTVQVARPDVHRAKAPAPRPGSVARVREASAVARIVAAVRKGDRVAAARPQGFRASTPGDVRSLLLEAVTSGEPVLVTYVDNHGTAAERLVVPLRVEGGQLLAHEPGDPDDVRGLAIHRIAAARRTDRAPR